MKQPSSGAKCIAIDDFKISIPCQIEVPNHSASRVEIVWYFKTDENEVKKISLESPYFYSFMAIDNHKEIRDHVWILSSNLSLSGSVAMRYSLLLKGRYFCRPYVRRISEVFSASKSLSVSSVILDLSLCSEKYSYEQDDRACAGNIFPIIPELIIASSTPPSTILTEEVETLKELSHVVTEEPPIQPIYKIINSSKREIIQVEHGSIPWIFVLGTLAAVALVVAVLITIIGVAIYKRKGRRELQDWDCEMYGCMYVCMYVCMVHGVCFVVFYNLPYAKVCYLQML